LMLSIIFAPLMGSLFDFNTPSKYGEMLRVCIEPLQACSKSMDSVDSRRFFIIINSLVFKRASDVMKSKLAVPDVLLVLSSQAQLIC